MPTPQAPPQVTHVAQLAVQNGWREQTIGTSVRGVPITAWLPADVPTRVMWAAIHGEETTTLQLAHLLLRTVRAEDACAAVIPVLNPDGVLLGTRQNANGVDLNRNFPSSTWSPAPNPTYWPTTMTRTRAHRTQWSSSGSAAGSEPETAALIEFVEQHELVAVCDLHAPLECVIAQHERSAALARYIAEPTELRVRTELDEPTPGDSGTWAGERGLISVTYEVEQDVLPRLWHRHQAALVRMIVDPGAAADDDVAIAARSSLVASPG